MTEKRFIVADRWIKDNCIGAWLNIDFNTITDANLCCDLLNRIEKEKRDNGKLASKLLEENEQLKSENIDLRKDLGEFEKSINIQGLIGENEQLKQQVTHLTMYKNLFREFQKQLDGVKKKSDLDHKDFEDLIELTKGHVFDDEHGWIWLPINDR